MNNLARRGFIFGSATVASYGLLVGVQRVCFSAFASDQADDESAYGPVTIVQFADDGTRRLSHQPLISHFGISVRFRFLVADGAVEHFSAKWKRAHVVAALEIRNAGIVVSNTDCR